MHALARHLPLDDQIGPLQPASRFVQEMTQDVGGQTEWQAGNCSERRPRPSVLTDVPLDHPYRSAHPMGVRIATVLVGRFCTDPATGAQLPRPDRIDLDGDNVRRPPGQGASDFPAAGADVDDEFASLDLRLRDEALGDVR